MKHFFSFFLFLLSVNTNSQNLVLEYLGDNTVDFHIYSQADNSRNKIDDISNVNRNSVEGLVQSYFFASNNEWLKSNYLEEEHFSQKDEKHFNTLKKLNKEKSKVVFLHKFSFQQEGFEMCYINFIADLEGVDFKFPTLLSCIKKDNRWYVYNLPNQQKIRDILWTFRSCRILQLINGQKTNHVLMNTLIQKTLNSNKLLDINRLYDETLKWKIDDNNQSFFTMTDNNNCDDITILDIKKKVSLTAVFKNSKITIFDKNDQKDYINIISDIKSSNQNYSIYLKAKLDINYGGSNYSIIKYNLTSSNGKSIIKTKILDGSLDTSSKPISELIFLFENLNPQIFNDLSPSINTSEAQRISNLYKSTRGNLDTLNISKLYNLLMSNKTTLAKYIDE